MYLITSIGDKKLLFPEIKFTNVISSELYETTARRSSSCVQHSDIIAINDKLVITTGRKCIAHRVSSSKVQADKLKKTNTHWRTDSENRNNTYVLLIVLLVVRLLVLVPDRHSFYIQRSKSGNSFCATQSSKKKKKKPNELRSIQLNAQDAQEKNIE